MCISLDNYFIILIPGFWGSWREGEYLGGGGAMLQMADSGDSKSIAYKIGAINWRNQY